jgi:hypothetical protein
VILRGTVQAGRIVVEGSLTLNDGDEVMVVVAEPGVGAGTGPTGDSLWPAIVETLQLAERLGAELRAATEPPRLAIVPLERRLGREIATAAAGRG